GEGACFLVAPPGRELRPALTGWFAGFESLAEAQSMRVGYDEGGARFLGATFEPTPLYRFNAVCDLYEEEGLTIGSVHAHVKALQARFLEHVESGAAGPFRSDELVPSTPHPRGHFLTFRRTDAQALQRSMAEARIITDARGDRLRFGFGLYHTSVAVDALADRLGRLPG
ncbi:MAG: aminotransferase, partial [Planctomycetota bacterium]